MGRIEKKGVLCKGTSFLNFQHYCPLYISYKGARTNQSKSNFFLSSKRAVANCEARVPWGLISLQNFPERYRPFALESHPGGVAEPSLHTFKVQTVYAQLVRLLSIQAERHFRVSKADNVIFDETL